MELREGIIQEAAASMLVQIDMGMLDLSDNQATMVAAATELNRRGPLLQPNPLCAYSMLVGVIMAAAAYEKGVVQPLNAGEYSPLIKAKMIGDEED